MFHRTPSSFYSSRTKRARQEPRNRLEGLIDEEDVEDDDPIFAIGGFPLDVKLVFGCLGNQKDETVSRQPKKVTNDGVPTQLITDELLQLEPESFSLGFQMLRKLGWRDSRVIGEEGNVKSAPVVKVQGPQLPSRNVRPWSCQTDWYRNEDDVSGIGYNTEKVSSWKGPRDDTTQALLFQTQSISYLEEDDDEYDVFNNQEEDYLESIQDVVEKRAKMSKKAAEDALEKSSKKDILVSKLQFRVANKPKERKVYAPPTVPENYDTYYYPDKDKYATNVNTSGIQSSKRLLSSIKNAADRRILLGESLISVKGPTKKVSSMENADERPVTETSNSVMLSQEILDKLSKSMTERFTSSSENTDNKASLEATATAVQETKKGLGIGESKRQIQFWQPSRLLCKRFNVPQPSVSVETCKRTTSRIYTELPVFVTEKSTEQTHDTKENPRRGSSTGDIVDKEKEETELINSEFLRPRSERPSTELFRAIFEESSEEEDESLERNESAQDSLLYFQPNKAIGSTKTAVNNSKDIQRPRAVDYF